MREHACTSAVVGEKHWKKFDKLSRWLFAYGLTVESHFFRRSLNGVLWLLLSFSKTVDSP